jgi:catalase
MTNTTVRLLPLAAALCCVASQAQVTTPQPELKTTPVQMVDTINSVFGPHKARAIHTKGVMLEGTFTPAASAAAISKAPHLNGKPVPVLVRFSNFAGLPDLPDNDGLSAPRGLAVRFTLPDGGSTDIVTHSFNGFPSPNGDQFNELFTALAASGPKAAKPTALDHYLESHPVAKAFLTAPKPAPVSYGTLPYFGVNAFKFTNAAGKVAYGRYRIIPVAPAAYLSDADAAKQAPGYLASEIGQRVAKAPVQFKLMLQIAAKDDKVDDPSVAWPDSSRTVELGTLALTRLAANPDAQQKSTVFMPNSLPSGIEVEDQMVNFRSASYAVSFGRRQ